MKRIIKKKVGTFIENCAGRYDIFSKVPDSD